MQKLNIFSLGGLAAIAFVGCSKMNPVAADAASNISQGVCKTDVKMSVYDELFRLAQNESSFPAQADLSAELSKSLKATYNVRASDDVQVDAMANSLATMADDIVAEVQNPTSIDAEEGQLHLSAKETIVRRLARLELGDHSSVAKAAMQARLKTSSATVQQLAVTTLDCSSSSGTTTPTTPVRSGAMIDSWKSSQNSSVYGAWKTMAVAYQSCDAVDVAPLSKAVPAAVGVTILNRVPQSGGNWREVTNLNEFLSTNPYYKSYSKPSSSCFAVESNPLIYDFGGKPATTTTEVNLFKNAGSGATTSLGVDCSGFLATAQLSAGLKPKSSTAIRASYAGAISSNDFRDPSGSLDLDCLQKASFTASSHQLKPGDIIAINGHVIMVDSVGSDPFGINDISSVSSCTSANIASKNFDFSIIQSAPYKGALGIQRSVASDYIPTEPTISSGLVSYAIAACKARFGTSSTPSVSTLSVVRHSTSASCADSEVALTNQSCVASCASR